MDEMEIPADHAKMTRRFYRLIDTVILLCAATVIWIHVATMLRG